MSERKRLDLSGERIRLEDGSVDTASLLSCLRHGSSRRNFSIWAQLFCQLRVVGIGTKVGCVQSKHLTTHVRGERPFRFGPLRVGVCLEETMNRTIRYVLGAA